MKVSLRLVTRFTRSSSVQDRMLGRILVVLSSLALLHSAYAAWHGELTTRSLSPHLIDSMMSAGTESMPCGNDWLQHE